MEIEHSIYGLGVYGQGMKIKIDTNMVYDSNTGAGKQNAQI
jgi:hypothetical protein